MNSNPLMQQILVNGVVPTEYFERYADRYRKQKSWKQSREMKLVKEQKQKKMEEKWHQLQQMQTVETEGYDVKNALRARIMYLKRKLQDRPMHPVTVHPLEGKVQLLQHIEENTGQLIQCRRHLEDRIRRERLEVDEEKKTAAFLTALPDVLKDARQAQDSNSIAQEVETLSRQNEYLYRHIFRLLHSYFGKEKLNCSTTVEFIQKLIKRDNEYIFHPFKTRDGLRYLEILHCAQVIEADPADGRRVRLAYFKRS